VRTGIAITGIAALLTGMLVSLELIPSLTDFFSSYFPEYSKLLLLVAGFALLIISLLFPKANDAEVEHINPNDMKSCPSCGKLLPPDAFRCPKCGTRFKSLYEHL